VSFSNLYNAILFVFLCIFTFSLLGLSLHTARPIFPHKIALHSFFVLFLICTSSNIFSFLFSLFYFYTLFKYIFDHTKFPKLNLIHSFVNIGMLSSSVNLLHHVLCLFACFSNCALFCFQLLFCQQLSKIDKRGWLARWPPWSFTNPIWQNDTLCLHWSVIL